jgi:carbon monoxide dehydrogenase subunit G
MAKFPTEVESTVTVHVPLLRAYDYLWDVVGSSHCIPGLDSCVRVGSDTYRFVYAERSTGPLSIVVRYTARYTGNRKNEIAYEGTAGGSDNTDVSGVIRLRPKGDGTTQITLRQTLAPDTPVPRLLQGLVRSFAESEARAATKAFLANVKAALESPG